MKTSIIICSLAATLVFTLSAATQAEKPTPDPAKDKAAFEQAAGGTWREVFSDTGTGDWKQRWFLDGEYGTVKNSAKGMELTAGPEFGNNAHHMVLWTKESFEGDLKIDYEYNPLRDHPLH